MPARDRQTLQDKQRRRRAAWEAAETNLKAGFPEDRHGTVIRQPRSVVVLAQMAEEDIAQPRMDETADRIGTFVIAQMPVSLDDTHLQVVCIPSAHQHIHIIIGLQDYGISLGCIGYGLIGHPSQICHYHETAVFTGYRIPHSLRSIMRNYEMLYLHPAYCLRTGFREDMPA